MDKPPARPETTDREYSDEEREFLKAVEAYQKRTRKKFLTHCDVLYVAKSLGYRKAVAESPSEGSPDDTAAR